MASTRFSVTLDELEYRQLVERAASWPLPPATMAAVLLRRALSEPMTETASSASGGQARGVGAGSESVLGPSRPVQVPAKVGIVSGLFAERVLGEGGEPGVAATVTPELPADQSALPRRPGASGASPSLPSTRKQKKPRVLLCEHRVPVGAFCKLCDA